MALDLGSLSSDFLKTQLGRAQGLQTGTIQPWDTPEFQSLANNLSKGFMNQRGELEKVMAAKGITGGAAADMFNNLNSQDMSAKLGAINQIRQHYGDLGTGIANQDLGRQMQEWQTQLDQAFKQQQLTQQAQQFERSMGMKNQEMAQQAYMQRKGIKSQEDIAKGQMISQNTSQMLGGTQNCCFIFIQGEGVLTDSVRQYRDSHYGNQGDVANGYRWMASWLVPLMEKSKFVTLIVRIFMTKPLTEYSLGKSIYMPFKIWPIIWSLIAKIRRM